MPILPLMAVCESFQHLPHNTCVELLRELDQTAVKQSHEVVVHELKDQVERAFVFAKVHGLLLVGHNLLQLDYVLMLQWAQDLNLTNSGDGKTLLFVFKSDLFKGQESLFLFIGRRLARRHGLKYFPIGSLAHLVNYLVQVDEPGIGTTIKYTGTNCNIQACLI